MNIAKPLIWSIVLIFWSGSLSVAAPLTAESASSLEGRYRIESIQCLKNRESLKDCAPGEEIEVSISSGLRGKVVLLQELKEGRVLREWRLSTEQSANPEIMVNSLLTEKSDLISSTEYKADAPTVVGPRHVTRTSVVLAKAEAGFTLNVRKQDERASLGHSEALGETELNYKLIRNP